MKKAKKIPQNIEKLTLEDPAMIYGSLRSIPSLKELTYKDFKKVSDKAPFTKAEWADILHVSERTLQRYAKDNHAFAPINAERLMLIDKVIHQGKITFGNTDNFYNWLKRNPYMLEGNLSINSLSTYEGIQNVMIQLSRIQHGIFA